MKGGLTKNVDVKANWAWMRYGTDFCRDSDGRWRIWHLHVFGIFMTPYEKSWVDIPDAHEMDPLPPEWAPDRPNTYSWHYSTEGYTEYVPAPPEPYEHFDMAEAF
jgi:hypothetical protein